MFSGEVEVLAAVPAMMVDGLMLRAQEVVRVVQVQAEVFLNLVAAVVGVPLEVATALVVYSHRRQVLAAKRLN
jgi:hypothetical protein